MISLYCVSVIDQAYFEVEISFYPVGLCASGKIVSLVGEGFFVCRYVDARVNTHIRKERETFVLLCLVLLHRRLVYE